MAFIKYVTLCWTIQRRAKAHCCTSYSYGIEGHKRNILQVNQWKIREERNFQQKQRFENELDVPIEYLLKTGWLTSTSNKSLEISLLFHISYSIFKFSKWIFSKWMNWITQFLVSIAYKEKIRYYGNDFALHQNSKEHEIFFLWARIFSVTRNYLLVFLLNIWRIFIYSDIFMHSSIYTWMHIYYRGRGILKSAQVNT